MAQTSSNFSWHLRRQNGKFKFGIALDLARTRVDQIQNTTSSSGGLLNYFTAWVGYKYDVANYNFSIEPSVAVKKTLGMFLLQLILT